MARRASSPSSLGHTPITPYSSIYPYDNTNTAYSGSLHTRVSPGPDVIRSADLVTIENVVFTLMKTIESQSACIVNLEQEVKSVIHHQKGTTDAISHVAEEAKRLDTVAQHTRTVVEQAIGKIQTETRDTLQTYNDKHHSELHLVRKQAETENQFLRDDLKGVRTKLQNCMTTLEQDISALNVKLSTTTTPPPTALPPTHPPSTKTVTELSKTVNKQICQLQGERESYSHWFLNFKQELQGTLDTVRNALSHHNNSTQRASHTEAQYDNEFLDAVKIELEQLQEAVIIAQEDRDKLRNEVKLLRFATKTDHTFPRAFGGKENTQLYNRLGDPYPSHSPVAGDSTGGLSSSCSATSTPLSNCTDKSFLLSQLATKANVGQVAVLNEHANQVSEKLHEVDDVLQNVTFRLHTVEADLLAQRKDVVTFKELNEFRDSLVDSLQPPLASIITTEETTQPEHTSDWDGTNGKNTPTTIRKTTTYHDAPFCSPPLTLKDPPACPWMTEESFPQECPPSPSPRHPTGASLSSPMTQPPPAPFSPDPIPKSTDMSYDSGHHTPNSNQAPHRSVSNPNVVLTHSNDNPNISYPGTPSRSPTSSSVCFTAGGTAAHSFSIPIGGQTHSQCYGHPPVHTVHNPSPNQSTQDSSITFTMELERRLSKVSSHLGSDTSSRSSSPRQLSRSCSTQLAPLGQSSSHNSSTSISQTVHHTNITYPQPDTLEGIVLRRGSQVSDQDELTPTFDDVMISDRDSSCDSPNPRSAISATHQA